MSSEPIRKRVWVQNVAVNAAVLQHRLAVIEAGVPAEDARRRAAVHGVHALLERALDAAYRENPIPTRWSNWWRGTLIEASYQHLHAAEAELAALYSDEEVDAEVAEAVARVEAGLNRDDPRVVEAHELLTMPAGATKRACLRKVIEVGYAAVDRQHSRIRSFRNVVLVAAGLIATFTAAFVAVVGRKPNWVPLCFVDDEKRQTFCPTGTFATSLTSHAASEDVIVVALLGLTGGAVAATVAIRNMRGTSMPYDIPVALACLKLPFGALSALVALIALRGEFVPGLSQLDSQAQIVAYSLVFGYGQQALTHLIDRQAHELLDNVPSKDRETPRKVSAPLPRQRFHGTADQQSNPTLPATATSVPAATPASAAMPMAASVPVTTTVDPNPA